MLTLILLCILNKLVHLILLKSYNPQRGSYNNPYFTGKKLRVRQVKKILELGSEPSSNWLNNSCYFHSNIHILWK